MNRHNVLALGFLVIGIGLGMVFYFIEYQTDIIEIVVLILICNLGYCSKEILEKWLMDIKYISVYLLVFLEGIFGCLMMIIIISVCSQIECPIVLSTIKIYNIGQNIFSFAEEIKLIHSNFIVFIFGTILYVLLSTGYNIFSNLTNKHFGTLYRVIVDTLSSFSVSIISMCLPQANYSKDDMIYIIVGFVFIIIGVIIYNEFILIHLCGMDVNTKKRDSSKIRL